jgi:hypothetical protein
LVLVTAARSFIYNTRALTAGTVLEMTPIDAAILARQGKVYLRGDLSDLAVVVPTPRPKRAYRRRTMTAPA